MINQRVIEYINDHSFCPEYLFIDWEEFLQLLYSEGGKISAILWWDHCKKSEQKNSAGGGGYPDPDNAEYMYAETQIYEDGFKTKTLDEIKKHIIETRNHTITYNNYKCFDLVPSFYLCE